MHRDIFVESTISPFTDAIGNRFNIVHGNGRRHSAGMLKCVELHERSLSVSDTYYIERLCNVTLESRVTSRGQLAVANFKYTTN